MSAIRAAFALLTLAVLCACNPSAAVDDPDYQKHKSNRQAYLYQSI